VQSITPGLIKVSLFLLFLLPQVLSGVQKLGDALHSRLLMWVKWVGLLGAFMAFVSAPVQSTNRRPNEPKRIKN